MLTTSHQQHGSSLTSFGFVVTAYTRHAHQARDTHSTHRREHNLTRSNSLLSPQRHFLHHHLVALLVPYFLPVTTSSGPLTALSKGGETSFPQVMLSQTRVHHLAVPSDPPAPMSAIPCNPCTPTSIASTLWPGRSPPHNGSPTTSFGSAAPA